MRDLFQGEFKKDKKHGKGTYTYPDGNKYTGTYKVRPVFFYISTHYRIYFQNDLENGNGTFVWADGYRYTGAFIDGLKTGYGEYYYKNGDNYKGMFQVEEDYDDADDYDRW